MTFVTEVLPRASKHGVQEKQACSRSLHIRRDLGWAHTTSVYLNYLPYTVVR